jgi:glycosyltransferase involved in cell wall biosynthesis
MYFWFTIFERWHYGVYNLLAHRMFAVSAYVRQFTIDHFPLMNEAKIVVVRNGIPLGPFLARDADTELRRRHGIPAEATVVGFVGRLTEQKGIEYLIDALAELAPAHPGLWVVIVGEGELRDALMRRGAALPQVVFAGFQREIPRYLAMFDIFALPSLWEGLPMSVLEAMAAGKPVVATAVSGTPEVVVEGETGFLVEPKNVPQLAERLSRLAQDRDLRLRMGAAGRARVTSLFSAEAMVRASEAIYRELLARP